MLVIESHGNEDRKTAPEVFGDLIKTERQRRVEFVEQQVAKLEEDVNKFLLLDLFQEHVNKSVSSITRGCSNNTVMYCSDELRRQPKLRGLSIRSTGEML